MQQDCIFCKIAKKEVPVQPVYEDEQIIAFPDINPAAPVHVLVIPKKHIANLLEITPEDRALAGHIMTVIPQVAARLGVAEDGFRVVINTKDNGGQTVHHLHCHILGGRFMTWPPG
ncbi:histidine triad nucleotide-binding protein [Sporolituus thermophilus]|uniref:Histidine triad (HIT) family protein n=1 Tax=Sporolituus thermophilus DSM 23256 TaxID=1123285 RepID=A0A1G7NN04_9FIRM|nr:histidine triad nucleotide-binding protein [Sporolituus thermophilus]SDF74669.1 histidine triad (HIT) family protein [Sporolituus thermophilus DSM 23256]